MWIWIMISMMENIYKESFFDRSFKNRSLQHYITNKSVYSSFYSHEALIANNNLKKINIYDFGTYSLEFLCALPFPACEALWYIGRYTYFPGSVSGSFSDYLLAWIVHTGLNILFVNGPIHLIGTLTKKDGNLKNSIIGTTIASAITFTIMAVTLHEKYYGEISGVVVGFVFPPIIGFLPPLSGVIGYNLK